MLRRIDPLGPLVAILGFGVFLLHGYDNTLARDLALYSYSGQQLADGVPPYVSVMNRAGPLAHVVPGIGAVLADWFGKDVVLTQRFVMTLLSVATVWVIYLIGRDLFRSRAAGALAATTAELLAGDRDQQPRALGADVHVVRVGAPRQLDPPRRLAARDRRRRRCRPCRRPRAPRALAPPAPGRCRDRCRSGPRIRRSPPSKRRRR